MLTFEQNQSCSFGTDSRTKHQLCVCSFIDIYEAGLFCFFFFNFNEQQIAMSISLGDYLSLTIRDCILDIYAFVREGENI